MEKANLTVRQAKPGDGASVLRIYREAWLQTYPSAEHGVSREDVDAATRKMLNPNVIESFDKRLEGGKTYVAVDPSGEVVGAGSFSEQGGDYEIKTLYVDPARQGCGVGGLLLKYLLEEVFAAGVRVLLGVASYNTRAIEFYRKHGFAETGVPRQDPAAQLPSGKRIPEIEMARSI